jgi:hypothetical protein
MRRNLGKRSFSCSFCDAGANEKASQSALLILIRLIAICFVSPALRPYEDPQNRNEFVLFVDNSAVNLLLCNTECKDGNAASEDAQIMQSTYKAVSKITSKFRGKEIGAALLFCRPSLRVLLIAFWEISDDL